MLRNTAGRAGKVIHSPRYAVGMVIVASTVALASCGADSSTSPEVGDQVAPAESTIPLISQVEGFTAGEPAFGNQGHMGSGLLGTLGSVDARSEQCADAVDAFNGYAAEYEEFVARRFDQGESFIDVMIFQPVGETDLSVVDQVATHCGDEGVMKFAPLGEHGFTMENTEWGQTFTVVAGMKDGYVVSLNGNNVDPQKMESALQDQLAEL